MARTRWLVGTSAAVGLGAAAVAVIRHRTAPPVSPERWNAVTIQDADALNGATAPPPLDRLDGSIEWEVRPAPGCRGIELRARPTGVADRRDEDRARRQVRAALREAKQLLEVGEVTRREPESHGRRSVTPWGAALDAVSGRAAEEGVL